jgi:alkylated DNA repair protein alkB family protein 6
MDNGTLNRPLQAFRVAGLPPDFYYIPNFITPEEETSILQKVSKLYGEKIDHSRYMFIW